MGMNDGSERLIIDAQYKLVDVVVAALMGSMVAGGEYE